MLPYVRNPVQWHRTSQTLQLFTNFYRLSNLFHKKEQTIQSTKFIEPNIRP